MPGRLIAGAALGVWLALALVGCRTGGERAQSVTPPESAAPFYVATDGNDAWSGRLAQPNRAQTDGPFRTLGKAAAAVKAGDTCYVRQGVYRETLTLSVSGTPAAPITFRNCRKERAEISGADPVGGWRTEGDGSYSAALAWDLEDRTQIFAGGAMLTEARWPNNAGTLMQPTRATVAAGSATTITDPNLPGGDDFWKGALLWCAGGSEWYCWATRVTAYDAKTKTLTFDPKPVGTDRWYVPTKGNPYALMGLRNALDADGEWWFDRTAKRLFLRPPGKKPTAALVIEAKRRINAMDLSGCAYVRVIGLAFRAGGILTDAKTHDLLLADLRGEDLGHSYQNDISASGAVVLRGRKIEVNGCEFAYGSGSLLNLQGDEHTVVNCYIHDGDYAGKWNGTVALAGRRHVVAHNTVRHSGRDLVSIGDLSEAIIEYNDLSHAGWLTHDLGMMYGHTTDFQNTVIRYNHVHDNMTRQNGKGIYFDHLSLNAIVYGNVVWNVPNCPIKFNNPGYFDLVFNNTAFNTHEINTFDHSRRNDLFGVRFCNNIVNEPFKLPAHVFFAGNVVSKDPGFADPARLRFDLKPGSPALGAGVPLAGVTEGAHPDAGAFQHGQPLWKVGHDFAHPPAVPVWQPPDIAYMNGIRNSAFEYGLEGWTKTGAGQAQTVRGNGWGNGWGRGTVEPTGTCKGELRLGGGADGVEQAVTGLFPDTAYTLSGWVKVADAAESVRLGVRDFGGSAPEVAVESRSAPWVRLVVEFMTGPASTSAVVFVQKTSDGPGYAFADNLGLPKRPPGTEWERPAKDAPPTPARPAAAVSPPFTAPRVSRPPVVDGRLAPAEWPDRAMQLRQGPGRETLETPPCLVKVCHDGRTLYVAVTVPVTAPARLKHGGKWIDHDGAEVCFAQAQGEALGPIFVLHGFADGKSESVTDAGVPPSLAKKLGDAVRYAATVGAKEWTAEWAIPLSAAGLGVTPGTRLAFNAGVRRTESAEWVIWVGALGETWRLQNAGVLVLE